MKFSVNQRTVIIPFAVMAFGMAAVAGWYAVQAAAAPSTHTAVADLKQTDANIKVFKTSTCGCCANWVEHLEGNGFTVETVDVDQGRLHTIKQQTGLGRELASCHTAFIDDYVVEGHVPAQDIRRLMDEQPAISGLSVPGMPIGSPGMEAGGRQDRFDVVTFDQLGNTTVFSSYNQ